MRHDRAHGFSNHPFHVSLLSRSNRASLVLRINTVPVPCSSLQFRDPFPRIVRDHPAAAQLNHLSI